MTMVHSEVNNDFREGTLPPPPVAPVHNFTFDSATKPHVPSFEKNTPPATDDIIVRGEDVYSGEAPEPKSPEEVVSEGIESIMLEIDAWLVWKVKNELIVQIVEAAKVGSSEINAKLISDILMSEIMIKKDEHFQRAESIERDIIPAAQEKRTVGNRGNDYSIRDVPNLQARVEIDYEVARRLFEIEASGEAGVNDLSKKYIDHVLPVAQGEVIGIIMKQKQDTEAEVQGREAELEALRRQVAELQAQINDQDSQEERYHSSLVPQRSAA